MSKTKWFAVRKPVLSQPLTLCNQNSVNIIIATNVVLQDFAESSQHVSQSVEVMSLSMIDN